MPIRGLLACRYLLITTYVKPYYVGTTNRLVVLKSYKASVLYDCPVNYKAGLIN